MMTAMRPVIYDESNFSTPTAATPLQSDDVLGNSEQLFLVSSYSDFDKLAHGPRGTQAKNHPLSLYRFEPKDGSLILLNMLGDPTVVQNPAFSQYHHRLNVVYTCTEDIYNNGKIFAYAIGANGQLTQLGEAVDAAGKSTCYLTIDKAEKNLLAVNYWDSTLSVIPLSTETGEFMGPVQSVYDPNQGQKMVAAGRTSGGVNHSNNDDGTIRMRQADPHSHALVLDPYVGTVAYIPDLGKDLIREMYYDREVGKIEMELSHMPSGLSTGMPDGPRYIEFHPHYNIAYVVNELSSTVAVFEVDRDLVQEMSDASKRGDDMSQYKGRSTLRLIQSIKTLPSAFPTKMNTCGRIAVHKTGNFVVVSNRGHQSAAVFRVSTKPSSQGMLSTVGFYHTRGETPRHFEFDASGQYLLAANQDTDSLAVFHFNLSSGEIKFTGNEYRVPSPNFVCSIPAFQDEDRVGTGAIEISNLSVVTMGRNDSDESSENSTIPVYSASKEDLEAQLVRSRLQISELQLKLLALSSE